MNTINHARMVKFRWFYENFLVTLFQFFGLTLTTLTLPIVPVSFAAGTAAALIFMRGASILPGIGFGTFIAYCWAGSGVNEALLAALAYMLLSGLLLNFSYRVGCLSLVFTRWQIWVKFLLISALVCALPVFDWPTWVANMNGIFMLGTAIATWDYYFPQWTQVKTVNLKVLSALIVCLIIAIFGMLLSQSVLGLMLSVLAMLMTTFIISFAYGWCGAVFSLFLTGILVSLKVIYNDALLPVIPAILFLQMLGAYLIALCR